MTWLRRNTDRILSGVVLSLCFGVVVLYILVIPTVHRVSRQALAGNEAKARQCQTLPAAVKVYTNAERIGWITSRDLAVFLRTEPRC